MLVLRNYYHINHEFEGLREHVFQLFFISNPGLFKVCWNYLSSLLANQNPKGMDLTLPLEYLDWRQRSLKFYYPLGVLPSAQLICLTVNSGCTLIGKALHQNIY